MVCNLLNHDHDDRIERINYLNKRLNLLRHQKLIEAKSTNTAAGWGNSNG